MLRYRWFWVGASIALTVLVVWGSLQTAFNTGVPAGFDKVEHFSTYAVLAVWFTGMYPRGRYWIVTAGLLALGLLMEIAQVLMNAGRVGDPYDMAANSAGVAVGLLLAWSLTGGWAQRVEAWLR